MDFTLPEETIAIRDMVRDFSKKEIEPLAARVDKEDFFPHELFKKMGRLGILGITIPEEYGGSGLDYLTQGIILEEISYYSGSIGLSYGAHSNLVADNINRNGNDGQKEKYLPDLITGEKMGSLCLTEPSGGSDALGSMKTTYRKEDGHYVINGSKTFITNAPVADTFLVYSRNGNSFSAFLVEKADGVETPKWIDKMGMRGSPTGEVYFNNVKIPGDRLMRTEGDGKKIIYEGLNAERAVLAFGPLGIARRALDEAIAYSNQREQFGTKIGNFQLIQEKIAYMFSRLEASKLLAYEAAIMTKDKIADPSYAASSIMIASETATQIAKDALQIFGGYGYTSDFPLERLVRDAILYEIGAGTTEIRKIIIAKALLKR
ncbi:MAG: acyl-CoA dehydrogenase family protein [Candidatus Thermoplasmatota archaeon]|jgi:isovaleryl-CoA dehydrogenase|nr:acyl-CoA dehydrogenase family protein [Candidatus Thermoplasmatota archaeon]MCL5681311.1 acyl-CoA dehydrogenase family protein [Candidatus Thermoplasmatota archaeon]